MPQLERQITALLFERLTKHRNPDEVRALARDGQHVATPADVIKDPFVLEFLDVREHPAMLERDIEQAIIDRLQISSDGVRWWTYAGGRINQTLKHALEELTGWKIIADNFHLRFIGNGLSQTSVIATLEKLAEPSFWEDDELWRKIVARIPPYRFSKFQVALPPRFELELVGRYLLDLDGARRFILGGEAAPAAERVADLLSRVISTFPVAVPGPPAPAIAAALPERNIRYIDSDAALAALCDQLATRAFITLDVETTLFDRNLCLIQVGTDDLNAVIDARASIDLEPLARIFESPQIIKVIHNATFERSVLGRINIRLTNVFDTLTASKRIRGKHPGGHSLAVVCKRELDKVLDKTQQVSDWTRRPLSPEQIAYAALDVGGARPDVPAVLGATARAGAADMTDRPCSLQVAVLAPRLSYWASPRSFLPNSACGGGGRSPRPRPGAWR